MTKRYKRLLWIIQVLFLAGYVQTSAAAKSKDLSPEVVKEIIQTASEKKNFSEEFITIIQAPDSVEKVLIQELQTSSNRWEARWFSAIALGKRGSEDARKALLKASQDELFIIRQAAIQALSYFEDQETLAAIRGALDDSAMVVRSEAVDAIMARRDVNAIDALEQQLYKKHNFQKGRSMWIRPQIVHAFGVLGVPEGLDPLMTALRDKDPKVVEQSCKSLQSLAIKNVWDYPVRYVNCKTAWSNWFKNRQSQQNTENEDET